MSRDYAKTRSASNGGKRRSSRSKPAAKRRNARKGGGGTPGWVWLFCGLCIGLVVAAGVYVFGRPAGSGGSITIDSIPGQASEPAPEQGRAEAEDDAEAEKKQKARFDFYEMLPNYEVVIPEEEYTEKPDGGGGNQTTTPKVEQPGRYVIQAGSFSSYDDADRRKAGLALLGVESEIEKVELDSGRTVYRVRTHPVNELDKLNATLKRLRENGIDTLVMRYKG